MAEHKSLAEALCAFQGEITVLHKGNEAKAGSYSYKYVDLADVVTTIQPLMLEHGLSFSAFPCNDENGKPALRYKLSHVSGDCESSVMTLMLSKADAQAHGSAISYARRYALCSVLNLVADADDDGAAARAAAEKRANGTATTAEEIVTAQDVAQLRDAAGGLTVAQLKLAFGSVGLTPPEPFVPTTMFLHVPKAKAAELHATLASIERQATPA